MLWSPGLDRGLPVVAVVESQPGGTSRGSGSGSDPGRWPLQGRQGTWISSSSHHTSRDPSPRHSARSKGHAEHQARMPATKTR